MSKTTSNYVEYIYVDIEDGEWRGSDLFTTKEEALEHWHANYGITTTEYGMFLEVILTNPRTMTASGKKLDSIPTYTI
jgi:hypothetical protein